MQKLRQILRFYSQGKGTKTISSIVGISRNTVKKYLQIFHTLHMDFEDVVCLEDSLFFLTPKPIVHDSRYAVLEPLLPSYCKRLRHKGMSRRKLYKEYISEHPGGYSLVSFDRFIQRYVGMSSPIMHLEHKAGDKLSIVDADSGEIIPVEVFVAILPCSQLTYVEAVMSQKKEDLITVCEASLHYIGGTPLTIVPDNLKAAVTKSSRYEATLNDDFASFAEYYGCAVKSANFRYKANVEEIDFSIERGMDRNQILRLAELGFVKEHKDLFVTGSTGTGKSYLVTVLGYQVCLKGFKVMYASTARLMGQLKAAKAKGTILLDLKKIERMDMLILDDFGIQLFDAQTRGLLLDIIEDRHGKKSTVITSQVPVKGWYDIIGEKTIADAILDRIVHQAVRVELTGDSLRKKNIKKESVYL